METIQRAGLLRQRRIATGLLVVMASLFLATSVVPEPSPIWIQLLRAASEAALVGGLADWFAVTALFRSPFSLPIPHTAIIPRNKDRIGENLGHFVERNFMEPRLLAAKLHSLDLGKRVSAWLAVPDNAHRLAAHVAPMIPLLLNSIADDELRGFLRRTLRDQLRTANLAPLLGRLLEVMVEAQHHQALFDRALLLATELLVRHEDRVYAVVSNRSGWWVPPSIDRSIARKLLTGVHELLEELADHNHEARRGFDRAVHLFIHKLQRSAKFHAQVDKVKGELLEHPVVQGYLSAVLDELRRLLLEDVQAPDSHFVTILADAFVSLGRNLSGDHAVRMRLNTTLEQAIVDVTVPWRHEVGRFIAEVVHRWDTDTVVERVELVVGRDLQYIRINGTLVGALVGIVLFMASALLLR